MLSVLRQSDRQLWKKNRENSKTTVKDSLNDGGTPWSVGRQICIGFQTQKHRVPWLHCSVSCNMDGDKRVDHTFGIKTIIVYMPKYFVSLEL